MSTLPEKYEAYRRRITELRQERGWQLKHIATELGIPYDHVRYLAKRWGIVPKDQPAFFNSAMSGVYVNLDIDTHTLLKEQAHKNHVSMSKFARDILYNYLEIQFVKEPL